MRCEAVRDELIAYARGELDASRAAAVEEHLVRCAGCTQELEGARKVLALTQMADEASTVALARSILTAALEGHASDIHLEPEFGGARVRLRIDGVLQPGPEVSAAQYAPLVLRLKMMAGLNLSEQHLPQEGRVRMSHEGADYDLRVATVPYIHGEGMVIRIFSLGCVILDVERVGFSVEALRRVRGMLARPHGMIVVTGPPAAGKTTVLYALLRDLNRPQVKILTVEDPVEVALEGIYQTRVDVRRGLTFPVALRALLRQDPDVLMVGEIRDVETAEACLQFALTGHLVLTAMHTADATQALTRLLEVGLEPHRVAAATAGVVGQRLVRVVCPACREAYRPEQAVLRALGLTEEPPAGFIRGRGCDQCRGTGYRGRTGLFEVLTVDANLARLVVDRAPATALRAHALEAGLLLPFREDARAKIAAGVTTAEEVLRVLEGIAG